MISAVIVAAGEGRRLGGVAKALLQLGDATFLARIVDTLRADAAVDPVVVVGPPFGDAIAAHARQLAIRVVVNPAPERGMASSVACGFGALGDAAAAWLWPVDHPAVARATLADIRAERARTHALVVVPRYRGAGGHPPLIDRGLWPELIAGSDAPGGARAILAKHAVAIEVDDRAVIRDVDNVEQLGEVAR